LNSTPHLNQNEFTRYKIVAYVKDEGFNLNIMITTLKSVVSCDVFSLKNIMTTTLKSVVSCDVFSLENIMTTTLKSVVSCDVFSLENIMTTTLKSIVSCDVFSLEKEIQGTCFGHAFFKACQYVIVYEKVRKGLRYVCTEVAQRDLQKCIVWSKISGKSWQEWNKANVNSNLPQGN